MKIKLKDYERIYKIINTIILNENSDPTVACTFFSFYGAKILREHYKMDAQPVAGMCFYHMGGDNILSFGKFENGDFASDIDAFHCWIIVDGWLIDFMAPAFTDINAGKKSFKSKMMQKKLSDMSPSIDSLSEEGDFYFESNLKVLEDRKSYLSSSLAYSDLADICSKWFKKPPKKIRKSIQIGDGNGHLNTISLVGKNITEAW